MEYTKEIETPIGKHKVVFKTMVTGAERERIDGAQMKYMEVKEGREGRQASVTDVAMVTVASKHELLRVSVVSIDGDEINCFERLHKMWEIDYDFVCNQIEEEQKKMTGSTSAAS